MKHTILLITTAITSLLLTNCTFIKKATDLRTVYVTESTKHTESVLTLIEVPTDKEKVPIKESYDDSSHHKKNYITLLDYKK